MSYVNCNTCPCCLSPNALQTLPIHGNCRRGGGSQKGPLYPFWPHIPGIVGAKYIYIENIYRYVINRADAFSEHALCTKMAC